MCNQIGRGSIYYSRNQRGVALLIGMILLLILTIVGIGSMSTVTMNELMTSNMHNQSKAFHGAEAGLTNCEVTKMNPVNWVHVGDLPINWWKDKTVWSTSGINVAIDELVKSDINVDGLAHNPRCIIEYVGEVTSNENLDFKSGAAGAKWLFRITAYAPGADSKTQAVLESIYVCSAAICDPDASLIN